MTTSLANIFPLEMDLRPVSRRPCRLSPESEAAILAAPLPAGHASASRAVSIVIVTYNGLVFSKACLASVLAHSGDAFEVIVVDNASTDGTPAFLRQLAARDARVNVILSDTNLGFAAANNRGLSAARGHTLVMLNNDTIVPPHWLRPLLRELAKPNVGLVGPVTNRTCNEARIETDYTTFGGLLDFAHRRADAFAGRSFNIPMLAMFCTAMRRDTYAKLGPIDERYAVGMFEDDDYSACCKAAGLRVVCAEDAYVHHFGEASFGALFADGEFSRIFDANKQRFEQKWNTTWTGHALRAPEGYAELIAAVHAAIRDACGPSAKALIVTKGDPAFIAAPLICHFPCDASGACTGGNPRDGADALAMLEDQRARGATHFVLPQPSAWWTEHYAELAAYLAQRCRAVATTPACRIWRLPQENGGAA